MSRTLILIAGGTSGVGATCARLLVADWDFVLVARRADLLCPRPGDKHPESGRAAADRR
ncbi:hypothetical protein ACFYXC_37955 [Streptomyces sp. NPDC002701]|uniref:hypothetical protein n=1 Tax=Streptomyces sp. NPDC002701 TaxID=3364661 RepID=UPI0036BC9D09